MENLVNTSVDLGSPQLGDCEYRDEILTFGGLDTFVPGTLLARLTDLSVSAGTVQGGTGTGTLTSVALVNGPDVAIPGVYVLTCKIAASHGGIWQLVDPNGAIVADHLQMTAGSGLATTFEVGGLTFILTDATDFIAGNYFEITVVAGGKLVPYNPAGVGGAQFPKAVLVSETSKAGAGDVAIRALVSGKVKKERLIIDVDGDGDNITNAILDQLRAVGIIAVDCEELGRIDNPQS